LNIICYTSSTAAICEGVITVKELSERIKAYRNKLHLSQEYVASFLGINRAAVTQIEAGNRKVSAEELSKLSTLFGITADELLNGAELSAPATMFARSFEGLSETDQAEIMNLIRFKEMLKEQRN